MDILTLPQFIESVGDEAAARLFDAEVRTVQSWRRRERLPRPDKAQHMVAAAGGCLSMDSIYVQPTAPVEAGEQDPDAGRIEPMAELP